jgi:hypothetical protein
MYLRFTNYDLRIQWETRGRIQITIYELRFTIKWETQGRIVLVPASGNLVHEESSWFRKLLPFECEAMPFMSLKPVNEQFP